MSYTPTEWKTGDVITAEKLNNMESGIVGANVLVAVNAEMDVVNNNVITVKNVDHTYLEVAELMESGKTPIFFVSIDLVAQGSTVGKKKLLFSNVSYNFYSQQSNGIIASYFEVGRDSATSPYKMPCFILNFNSSGMTIVTYNVTVSA